jgi:hypothetical protein
MASECEPAVRSTALLGAFILTHVPEYACALLTDGQIKRAPGADRLPTIPRWLLQLSLNRPPASEMLNDSECSGENTVHGIPKGRHDFWLRAREPLKPKGSRAQVELVALEVDVDVEQKTRLTRDLHVELDARMVTLKAHAEVGKLSLYGFEELYYCSNIDLLCHVAV